MAIKRLKPKWNQTAPTSTAAPPVSAGEIGEFLINRQTGNGYIKKNDGNMQDVGPVKSVNGEVGAVVISSDDVSADGLVFTSSSTIGIGGHSVRNGKIIVIDSATDINVTIADGIGANMPVQYAQILICQKQAGRAVFSGAGGTVIISQGGLLASGGAGTMCSLVRIAENTWMLGGSLS